MTDVVLVGPDQQDNMALRYLAGSLIKEGHTVLLTQFNDHNDTQSVLDCVKTQSPQLVGFGISFQYAIEDYLNLARALRISGYKGHITCGGHVPTFCYEEIFKDAPQIDTVVRHDGEHTLLEILLKIKKGEKVAQIDGLVWKENNKIIKGPTRAPVLDLDALPLPMMRHAGPLSVGGIPISFLIAARGCFGECSYCSIAAFSKDAGGPRFRMRTCKSVALEMAKYYYENNVRTFFFQDDIFILPSKTRTLKRIDEFIEAFKEQNFKNCIFWVKGRPENMTPEVLKKARQMGVVHIFLGIESACDDRLKYLGRTHNSSQNLTAITNCEAAKIRPSFNLMLFDPDTTLEEVAQTIDFAEQTAKFPWNICRTEIYSGTNLEQKLKQEGRLMGNYKTYGYVMKDLRAEIMFRIMRISFKEHALAVNSLLNSLISIAFSRQAHEAFFPGSVTDHISAKVDELLIDAHIASVNEMRRIMHFAAYVNPQDNEKIRQFAINSALKMAAENKTFFARYHHLWNLLNVRGLTLYKQLLSA